MSEEALERTPESGGLKAIADAQAYSFIRVPEEKEEEEAVSLPKGSGSSKGDW